MAQYMNSLLGTQKKAAVDILDFTANTNQDHVPPHDNNMAIRAMTSHEYTASGLTCDITYAQTGLFTEPNDSDFTSFGDGSFKSYASKKVWTCCSCGDSGMAVRHGGEYCPCGHYKCDWCKVESARAR